MIVYEELSIVLTQISYLKSSYQILINHFGAEYNKVIGAFAL